MSDYFRSGSTRGMEMIGVNICEGRDASLSSVAAWDFRDVGDFGTGTGQRECGG